jgi:hypothetical protein
LGEKGSVIGISITQLSSGLSENDLVNGVNFAEAAMVLYFTNQILIKSACACVLLVSKWLFSGSQ